MDLWVSTLSYKDRGKLKMPRSSWGRCGGNIVAVGLRKGKTARRNRKLKRQREARLKAEQTAYEARRALPPPITDQNRDGRSSLTARPGSRTEPWDHNGGKNGIDIWSGAITLKV